MQAYTLPEFFGNTQQHDVFIYNYRSTASTEKNKVALSHHVVSFLLEGTKTVFLSNEHTTLHANHCMLLRSGHCIMTERTSSRQRYHSILLFFSENALQDFCFKYTVRTPVPHTPQTLLTFPYDDFISNFATSLSLFNTNNQALCKLKFEEFMLYCLEHHRPTLSNFFAATNTTLNNHLHNIVENALPQKLAVEEMAFLCNMSLSTFKREFFKHYHTSPQRWLHEQRLQKAAFLLTVEQQRPSDIFMEVGFENLSSFTQSFKKKFGITPKKYQEHAS